MELEREKSLSEKELGPIILEEKGPNYQSILIGVSHTKNTKHPQFDQILPLIRDFNPECVIFELPPQGVEALTKWSGEELIKRFGEIGTIYRSLQGNEKIIAGDKEYEWQKDYTSKNHTKKENEAYKEIQKSILQRMTIQEWREKEKDKEKEKIIVEYLEQSMKKPIEQIKDFKEQKGINPLLENPISKIKREMTLQRDQHMKKTFDEATKKYKKIVMILGKNHVIRIKENITK